MPIRVNVQQKFLGVSLATSVLTLGLALGGLWSSSALTARMHDNAITASALRHHLEADMMHDALRADVLAALQKQPGQQDAVRQDLAEHVDLFRGSIAANRALSLPPAVGHAITQVDQPPACCRDMRDLVRDGLFRCSGSPSSCRIKPTLPAATIFRGRSGA